MAVAGNEYERHASSQRGDEVLWVSVSDEVDLGKSTGGGGGKWQAVVVHRSSESSPPPPPSTASRMAWRALLRREANDGGIVS